MLIGTHTCLQVYTTPCIIRHTHSSCPGRDKPKHTTTNVTEKHIIHIMHSVESALHVSTRREQNADLAASVIHGPPSKVLPYQPREHRHMRFQEILHLHQQGFQPEGQTKRLKRSKYVSHGSSQGVLTKPPDDVTFISRHLFTACVSRHFY